MSRNLCRTNCYYCQSTPRLIEPRRPITENEAGVYFDEYEGMDVANAECPACKAKYLAWVQGNKKQLGYDATPDHDVGFFDLSFRSTFNDEPGADDLPLYPGIREAIPDLLAACEAAIDGLGCGEYNADDFELCQVCAYSACMSDTAAAYRQLTTAIAKAKS